jgi:hypothetical protein
MFIIGMSAADPIYCADGCGRAGVTLTQAAGSAGADCPFCLGLLDVSCAPFAVAIPAIIAIAVVPVQPPALLLATSVYRPPRATA